jgi:hypothetical protein
LEVDVLAPCLNEMTCFVQNDTVSCFFKQKEEEKQNGVVLSDTVPPSSSPRRATGEENSFCFFLLYSFLPCALPKPDAPSPIIMKNQGSRALPATPIGPINRAAIGMPLLPFAL